MTKTETLILKGVAILLMLYYHLFFQIENVDICNIQLYVGDTPFVYLLSRCTNPVYFFLILSGYGFYRTYQSKSTISIKTKILKLYIHYWITLAIFVTLGAFVNGPDRYPGSFLTFFKNFTGWYTSYNGEIWFLFPYLLIVVTSSFFYNWIKKYDWKSMFIIFGFIYFCSYIVIYLFGHYFYTRMLIYMPILYLSLLFPFVLGMMSAKYNFLEKAKLYFTGKKWMLSLLFLIGLIIVRMSIKTGIFHSIFALIFITLFITLPLPKLTNRILVSFGKRSTSMWFVHTYFCTYLFHTFIYSFKYPVIIFSVLIIVSYASALIIDYTRDIIYSIVGINRLGTTKLDENIPKLDLSNN